MTCESRRAKALPFALIAMLVVAFVSSGAVAGRYAQPATEGPDAAAAVDVGPLEAPDAAASATGREFDSAAVPHWALNTSGLE